MKICFIADLPTQTLGGSELQSYLIAKGLVARGWDVSYVTGCGERHSRDLPTTHVGFEVYEVNETVLRSSESPRGWWLKRYSRGLSLLRIIHRVDPDILFVSLGGSLAGFVVCYCLLYKKKLVYRAGNALHADLTFGRADLLDFGFIARRFHSFAVRNANVIVTNAKHVSDAFRKHLPNKLVQVIPNGLEIVPIRPKRKERYVLWLGRMEKVKNPVLFVRLAKQLPHIQFVMGGSGRLYQQVAKAASQIPNLTLVGLAMGEEKKRLLGSALVVVNTSLAESFPNTLIEAGMDGIPYISFVDPDEVICRHKLGFHVTSFRQLVEKTALLVRDDELRFKIGTNNRHYVENNHDIERSVSEYDRLLRSLV